MAQPPLYQQIADTIRRQIEEGELERGQQLPTELELRETFDASRNTIRDAVKRLAALGLVETRPGQGTFVTVKKDPFVTVLSSQPKPDLTDVSSVDPETTTYLSEVSAAHRRPRTTAPRVEVQVPPPDILRRLRLPPGSQTVSRHQQRFIDEVPWSLQTTYYPMEFITRGAAELLIARNIEKGAVRYLQEALELRQVGYRDWITARQPDEDEQRFFGIAHDATVFVIYRTGFDQHGAAMRVTVTIFPADRNQFIIDSGDLPAPRYEAGV
jgi:GntR family transcriptional regulator